MFSALDFCADDANVVVARKASNAFRRLHLDDEDDDAEYSSSAREQEEEHARWEDFRALVVLAKKSRRLCCRCNDDDDDEEGDEEEEEEEGANREEAFIFMRQRASFDFYLFTLRKKSNTYSSHAALLKGRNRRESK